MRRVFCLVILLNLNFITFDLAPDTAYFISRRIKSRNFVPLYEVASFLYREFGKDKFTIQEVMENATRKGLPGFDYSNTYYKLEIFVRVGVLAVERSKPNYYYFLPPFNTPRNLQLLFFISELHRAIYYSHALNEVEGSIRGKLEIIKTAIEIGDRGIIKVRLSPELTNFPELKMRLLIGIVGQKMIDLYKSFSEILIKTQNYGYPFRVDIDYDSERITITLPKYPLEYVYEEIPLLPMTGTEPEKIECDLMWNWIGNEHFRRELVQAVIQKDLQLEALISPLELYFFGGITLLYETMPGIISRRLTLLEKFISRRDEERFVNDYLKFISLVRKILDIRLRPVEQLSPTEKRVLILRYGIADPINPEPGRPRSRKEVAELLKITPEAVRQAEMRAREKLKLGSAEEIAIGGYLWDIEEILDRVEAELERP
ncbi:MAG: hypothetical protein NC898_04955 [Candidatus Omnitrophica bacterium]|nr:hypothetical protein [Candidatus Omnitrophota bacterium]MCM8793796.1 hypothetical protein [Candidatus Omnitrophota bacterium]